MERSIEASAAVRAELDAVALLLRDPSTLLRPYAGSPGRYVMQVVADLHDGATLRQGVVVDIGIAERREEAVRCTISWRPQGHERLLPTFEGMLEAREDVTGGSIIRIHGRYHPPLGGLGAVADSVALKRVARRTLADFTRDLAGEVDRAVDRRRGGAWAVAGPLPDDLRSTASEEWLG